MYEIARSPGFAPDPTEANSPLPYPVALVGGVGMFLLPNNPPLPALKASGWRSWKLAIGLSIPLGSLYSALPDPQALAGGAGMFPSPIISPLSALRASRPELEKLNVGNPRQYQYHVRGSSIVQYRSRRYTFRSCGNVPRLYGGRRSYTTGHFTAATAVQNTRSDTFSPTDTL